MNTQATMHRYKEGTLFRNTVSDMVGQITGYGETEYSKLDYYEIVFFSRDIASTSLNEFEVRHTRILFTEFEMLMMKDIIKIINLDLEVGDKFINTMNGTVATFIGLKTYGEKVEPSYKFKVTETEFDSFGYQPGKVNTKVILYSDWQIAKKLMQGFIKEVDKKDAYKWKYINDLRG